MLLSTLLAGPAACQAAPEASAPRRQSSAPSTQPVADAAPLAEDLFDPARHIRVSEVRTGMRGYGLTVMLGTEVQKFDVEVISVLHNLLGPRNDVVLVRCKGLNLELTGPIQGMSGSPIFLRDDQGRDRMLGAFAFGWPNMKECVAGIQPIEGMLKIPTRPAPGGTAHAAAAISPDIRRWDVLASPYWKSPLGAMRTEAEPLDAAAGPRPLMVPLMVGGASRAGLAELSTLFAGSRFVPMQSVSGGAAAAPTTQAAREANLKFEPGGPISIPMMSGDLELTAVGTVTEVIGDRVWAFGHPMNNEGPAALPMATCRVEGVIAANPASFKIGSTIRPVGTLNHDRQNGIAGLVGSVPKSIPVEIELDDASGEPPVTLKMTAADHTAMLPQVLAAALASSVSLRNDPPLHHTIDVEGTFTFAGGRELAMNAVLADDSGPRGLVTAVVPPVAIAGDNPFARVPLEAVKLKLKVERTTRLGEILSVNVPIQKLKPGQVVRGTISYRKFRGDEATLPFELAVPPELKPGDYQLIVSDYDTFLQSEAQARPFRFAAANVDEMFAVLRDYLAIRRDAVHVQLIRPNPGVAVGRVAMPQLPSSRRQVLLQAGRSDVTAFSPAVTKSIVTPVVLTGTAEFKITVEGK
jgi:hypothetical protein